MNSLSRNQIETLLKSNADDLQIAKTIAIQSKPDQTKTLVGGVLLALLANVVVPVVGPLVVLALTADKFMEQRRKANEVTHKIERGEVWEFIPETDRVHFPTLDPERQAITVPATSPASAQDETHKPAITPNTAIENERSLFLHLADNPFLCYFILASQRTGKTSSAAAATLTIKREKGTEVYYINLSDHGQGNREAFAHADRVAIGDINGGNPADAVQLVREAIAIIEQFHKSNNAILVVDEWVNLALKVRTGMDDFWNVLSPKAAALTSNGIGCGRSVWAIAPTFQAAVMREEAKVVKSFIPLILSVAPGQSIEWANPATGVVSKIPYNGSLVGQAARNWPDADIKEPTAEESRYWQRAGASRIFWADKQWSILGQAPALPQRSAVAVPAQSVGVDTVASLERSLSTPITTPKNQDLTDREITESDEFMDLFGEALAMVKASDEPVKLTQLVTSDRKRRKHGKRLIVELDAVPNIDYTFSKSGNVTSHFFQWVTDISDDDLDEIS
jgi:hypothetical protein